MARIQRETIFPEIGRTELAMACGQVDQLGDAQQIDTMLRQPLRSLLHGKPRGKRFVVLATRLVDGIVVQHGQVDLDGLRPTGSHSDIRIVVKDFAYMHEVVVSPWWRSIGRFHGGQLADGELQGCVMHCGSPPWRGRRQQV